MSKLNTRVRELKNSQYVVEIECRHWVFWRKWKYVDLRYGHGSWCDKKLKFLGDDPRPHCFFLRDSLANSFQCMHLEKRKALKIQKDFLSLKGI